MTFFLKKTTVNWGNWDAFEPTFRWRPMGTILLH